MIPPPRALILSPSASHPQDYGNRNRVWQITNYIKGLGYSVDFILYPVEAEWNEYIPPEVKDMQTAWDSFWIVPPTPGHRFHSRARGEYHEIDEWWDEEIGHYLRWLFTRRAYDLFIVNYTFLSKAFTFAPSTTTKILETHDLFTGRKELLGKLGVEPEFFYTTEERERTALERADIVIAIKDSEAEILRGWTDKEVISIPFYPETGMKPPRETATGFEGLSIGFIGAGNSINSSNLQAFLRVFDPQVRLYCPPLRLLIAGNVCQRLQVDNPAISLLGRVPNLADFYSQVDVIVAPMELSTGIKIKVGEALAFGKGVVSTANGYDGFPVLDSMHALRSMNEVSRALIELAFNPERRARLIRQSHLSARLAQRATSTALQDFAAKVRYLSPRIVVITDCPFWARGGFRAARLSQWAQLCGFLTRTIKLYLTQPGTNRAGENFNPLPDVLQIEVAGPMAATVDPVELAERLDAELRSLGVTQIMLSVDQPWAGELASELAARGHAPVFDLWCPALRSTIRKARGASCSRADFWVVHKSGGLLGKGELVEATALRYLPPELERWQKNPRSERLLLISTSGDPYGYEADVRAAAAKQSLPLTILPDSGPTDRAEAMFAALRCETETPTLLLVASTDMRIQSLCTTLGVLVEVPVVALQPHAFPLAVADEHGNIMLYQSSKEFLGELLRRTAAKDPLCFSPHKADTGWSHLWRIIERRVRAPQVEMLGEPRVANSTSRVELRELPVAQAASSPPLRAVKVTLDGAHS
jgi:glycosyltransferase involved in cell wall biosynthesis